MRMRVVSLVLAGIPFLVAFCFLIALSYAEGYEGLAVLVYFVFACIGLTILSTVAVVLAFLKRQPSKLDIPSRVASIISLVLFAPVGGFGILFLMMSMVQPAVNA